MIPPLVVRAESDETTSLAAAFIALGATLAILGIALIVDGRPRAHVALPRAVWTASATTTLLVAFFALETSDRIVRQDGQLLYWSSALLLPAVVLLYGLLTSRAWAWWTARGVFALGALWFVTFAVMIPFLDLQGGGVPVPWYGRLYMMAVSAFFAAVLAVAFVSLGRGEARQYFGRMA